MADAVQNTEAQATGENTTEATTNNSNNNTFNEEEFYNKLDNVLSKRVDGITKSILKDNGMADDEIKDFITKYKSRNEEKLTNATNELEKIKAENTALKQSIFNTDLMASTEKLADELGFNSKYTSQILKLADLSKVNDNGKINEENLKTSINKVLEDCEAFKATEQKATKQTGFTNIGGNKEAEENSDSISKIRKAMGLK